MRRYLAPLCVVALSAILSIAGCSTAKGDEVRPHILDMSQYERNVYVGLSGPYSTEEEMVRQAILNCAKTILLEQAVALDSRVVGQWDSTGGDRSFATDEHAYYDETHLAEVIGRLQILSVSFDRESGAIVVARDPEGTSGLRPYWVTYDEHGRPSWLDRYPAVSGYRFGIGSTKAYKFQNDSIEAADFSSAQDLLDRNGDHLFVASATTATDDTLGQAVYQHAKGLLQGFFIVSRYYDEETDTYWSLSAIKE